MLSLRENNYQHPQRPQFYFFILILNLGKCCLWQPSAPKILDHSCKFNNLDLMLPKLVLREATKKLIFLMAVPLRGGGGKSLAIKKKNNFKIFFLFCSHLKQKNILLQTNFSTYGHIKLKFVSRYFYQFVTVFSKNLQLP